MAIIIYPQHSETVNESESTGVTNLLKGLSPVNAKNEGFRTLNAFNQNSDNYIIIPNLTIISESGNENEIDCLVIAPNAIYVIDWKEWNWDRILIKAQNSNVTVKSGEREQTRKNPLNKAHDIRNSLSYNIKKNIPSRFHRDIEDLFVYHKIVFTNNIKIEFENPKSKYGVTTLDRTFVHLEKIKEIIKEDNQSSHRDKIKVLQRTIAEAITKNEKIKYKGNVYLIEDEFELTHSEYKKYENAKNANNNQISYFEGRRRNTNTNRITYYNEKIKFKYTTRIIESHNSQNILEKRIRENTEIENKIDSDSIIKTYEILDMGHGLLEAFEVSSNFKTVREIAEKNNFSEENGTNFLVKSLTSLKKIHDKNIFHRDINSGNVYLKKDDNNEIKVKFSEFNNAYFKDTILAKIPQGTNTRLQNLNTPYNCPEVSENNFDFKTFEPKASIDLYSLGIVFYELIKGKIPADNFLELGEKIKKNTLELFDTDWHNKFFNKICNFDSNLRFKSCEEALKFISENDRKYRLGQSISNYEIVSIIGETDITTIFKVRNKNNDKILILKLYKPEFSTFAQREIQILNELGTHENIVKLKDRGTEGRFNSEYLVFELIDGQNLEKKYLKENNNMEVSKSLKFLSQILSACNHLHVRRGVYHNDIKPANIIEVNGEDTFKLIDFNTASSDNVSQTPYGTYTPPDFSLNDQSKIASFDTYAIGVTLYNLLCSHEYFDKNNPVNPCEINEFITPSYGAFILKAVQPLYNKRFTSIREMINEFEKLKDKIKQEEREKRRQTLLPEDIFSMHKDIMSDYSEFIRESIFISNETIKDKVEAELKSNQYWPDPLIQFNPAFLKHDTIKNLVEVDSNSGEDSFLHRDLLSSIGSVQISNEKFIQSDTKYLYKHQFDAISKVKSGEGFLLTSGTGSGKTLSFLAGIFDTLLRENDAKGELKGVKAILVYPMNALVNSQYNEINTYIKGFKNIENRDFPIKCTYYTGDTSEEIRKEIKDGSYNIILTNYMMLEYILTRSNDKELRENIFKNTEFLVFDEIHMYSGRQGADVAMLIRRLTSQCQKDVKCIGTSATMVSSGSLESRKSVVANFATNIFGKKFNNDNIITETLDRYFEKNDNGYESLINDVRNLNDKYKPDTLIKDLDFTEEDLKNTSLSSWLENEISLTDIPVKDIDDNENIGTYTTRGKPLTLNEISQKLAEITELSINECENALKVFLKCISKVNKEIKDRGERKSYLPYKIHQFICETEGVYLTLNYNDANFREEKKYIGLAPESKKIKINNDTEIDIFYTYFSRTSGKEFIKVKMCKYPAKFIPDENFGDDDEDIKSGYLIPCYGDEYISFKSYYNDNPNLIKSDEVKFVYFDEEGNYSDEQTVKCKTRGIFIKEKFRLDPTSGVEYHHTASDFSKLSRLGNEGRSSSTTMINYLTFKNIANYNYSEDKRKILSFSDNRQDASLQSGHFNDFVSLIEIRKIIYNILKNTSEYPDGIDVYNLLEEIIKAYDIKNNLQKFASSKYREPVNTPDIEEALKNYLEIMLISDLENNWRVIFPDLERCGLLEIRYKNAEGKFLNEICNDSDNFKDLSFLQNFDYDKRLEFLTEVLDYFRNNLALAIDDNHVELSEHHHKLNDKYQLDKRDLPVIKYITVGKKKDAENRNAVNVSILNKLGKFIKSVSQGAITDKKSHDEFVNNLFNFLTVKGFLISEDEKKLMITSIFYKPVNKEDVQRSRIQLKAKDAVKLKTNKFFTSLYASEYDENDELNAKEHTAQIKSQERKKRENEFRGVEIQKKDNQDIEVKVKPSINILFCSPTMELGIDISELDIVHMRNVPPNPANYVQRSGRAGRSGQTAMVFVNCSSGSAHDMHYFRNRVEMVAGQVKAPKINIDNEDLVSAHIHSLCLSNIDFVIDNVDVLGDHIYSLVNDENNPNIKQRKYELEDKIKKKLDLDAQLKEKIIKISEKITANIENSDWLSHDWINKTVNNFKKDFNISVDRWRDLLKSVVIKLNNYSINTSEDQDNSRIFTALQRQRDLLLGIKSNNFDNEFYTYRYLASEGFIPGYNFPLRPVRVFLAKNLRNIHNSEFFSRNRELAIREFAPDNYIYHSGSKYQVEYVINKSDESFNFNEIQNTGFILKEGDVIENDAPSPIDGKTASANRISDCVPLSDMGAKQIFNITCTEENRQMSINLLEKYVSASLKDLEKNKFEISDDKGHILSFFPLKSADIYYINKGGKKEKFLLQNNTRWLSHTDYNRLNDEQKTGITECSIFTKKLSDIILISLNKEVFKDNTMISSFQYAIKKAIENKNDVETNEIGTFLIGREDKVNIIFFEDTQGTIKVLSRFKDPNKFKEVISEAINICYYKNGVKITDKTVEASYDDIKSYYNQSEHGNLNKWSIEDALYRLDKIESYGEPVLEVREEHEGYNIDISENLPALEKYLFNKIKEIGIPNAESFSDFEQKEKYNALHFDNTIIVNYKSEDDKEDLRDELVRTYSKNLEHCCLENNEKTDKFVERIKGRLINGL